MQTVSDARGEELLEKARRKMSPSSGPSTCWHDAYRSLFSSCAEINSDKERQERLAWLLSACFQIDSGRPAFPGCGETAPMSGCLKKLDDSQHKVFLAFYLETNSLCHQLQSDTFKHEMERLVNDLAESAQSAENMLVTIEQKADELLQDSNRIHDSLTLIDQQTEQIGQATDGIDVQIRDLSKNSESILEQSKDIAARQSELSRGQEAMRGAVESGMALLQESSKSLEEGMSRLRGEAVNIEREVRAVGESMASKMQGLQSTADDIGAATGLSLERQHQLLDGQAVAREGLHNLTKFQSQALEESRDTVKQLAEFGQKQQEELLQRQEQIQLMHDNLYENSQSILAAQKEFESKQANIFAALDRLFALHNAILAESRFIKAFFFYSCVIFLLYLLTSTKETFGIRAILYLGLCITFMLEFGVIRLGGDDFNRRTWIIRSSFLVAASIQILHSIFTFRDYEIMNHQLLQTLLERVRHIEESSGKKRAALSMESDDEDSDGSLSKYSWIDQELPEDVDIDEDPNYLLEEVAENSITAGSITRKYHLRPRARY